MTTLDLREERFCRSCGAPRTSGARYCPACGAEYAAVATMTGGQVAMSSAAPIFAGFWVRTGAYLLDTLVVIIVAFAIGFVLGMAGLSSDALDNAIGYGVAIGYFINYWTKGQTPGMKVTHLRVQRTDGSALTPARAVIRYLGLSLSFLALGIGVIVIAFDKNKQGWADKIADTYVVRV